MLPGVSGAWLADWERPDGIAMQTRHETAERLRSPLESAERHGRRSPRHPGPKRPRASSLAKARPA